MKPTKDEVLAWAREATKAINADEEILHTKVYVEKLAALAYAAGAAAMKERAARIADGWECEAAGGVYLTCGNGNFWDEGTIYDQGRADAAGAIRALGDGDE